MFGLKRRARERALAEAQRSAFQQLWERSFPTYSAEQAAAAQARLDHERSKFETWDWGEGPQRVATGVIDLRDLQIVHGPIVKPIWN